MATAETDLTFLTPRQLHPLQVLRASSPLLRLPPPCLSPAQNPPMAPTSLPVKTKGPKQTTGPPHYLKLNFSSRPLLHSVLYNTYFTYIPCFLPTSSRRQLPGHRGSVWSLLSPQRPACAWQKQNSIGVCWMNGSAQSPQPHTLWVPVSPPPPPGLCQLGQASNLSGPQLPDRNTNGLHLAVF